MEQIKHLSYTDFIFGIIWMFFVFLILPVEQGSSGSHCKKYNIFYRFQLKFTYRGLKWLVNWQFSKIIKKQIFNLFKNQQNIKSLTFDMFYCFVINEKVKVLQMITKFLNYFQNNMWMRSALDNSEWQSERNCRF